MKQIIKTLIITALIGINSCSSNIKRSRYDITYNMNMEVAKDKGQKETVELKRKIFIEDDQQPLKYNDQFIETEWQPVKDGFRVKIKNKINSKIKIIWNNAYFSDNESGSFKIKKSNLDIYNDEIVILPESFYENYIFPYGNSDERYFPAKVAVISNNQQQKRLNNFTQDLKDRFVNPVQILIPVEIDGTLYDYRFLFSFNDIDLFDGE